MIFGVALYIDIIVLYIVIFILYLNEFIYNMYAYLSISVCMRVSCYDVGEKWSIAISSLLSNHGAPSRLYSLSRVSSERNSGNHP